MREREGEVKGRRMENENDKGRQFSTVTSTGRASKSGMARFLDVDDVLARLLDSTESISDCLFIVGRPPQVESFGRLCGVPLPGLEVLTPEHTSLFGEHFMRQNLRLLEDYQMLGSCDTSYALGQRARFRVNVFRQNGAHGIVLRKLPTQIPSIDALGLAPVFRQMVRERNGIIFVTGATGNGKTTTLAALLNELNQTEDQHVVTLEDPIEFLHQHNRCTFSQRELGRDFRDFATGLRAALRQAPKVVFVGEIRDRETMEIALTAAETGHVVYTTLHTVSASMSINRILGLFHPDEEPQIRQRLADALRYIVSQRLVPREGGGRLLATEVMGSSLRSREAILLGEGEGRDLHEIIESASPQGWHSFEQSLLDAYRKGLVSEENAKLNSVRRLAISRAIDQLKKERAVSNQLLPEGLQLRLDPEHQKMAL
jgi:twitching motility protein PilT